jgi:hypothetical protein
VVGEDFCGAVEYFLAAAALERFIGRSAGADFGWRGHYWASHIN